MRGLRQEGKKPAKLKWTQASRRMHKKLNVETGTRRRVRKVVKATVTRATIGAVAGEVRRRTRGRPVRSRARPSLHGLTHLWYTPPPNRQKQKVAGVPVKKPAPKEGAADAKAPKVSQDYIAAQKEKAKKAAAERKKLQGAAKAPAAGAKHAGKGR